MNRREIAKELLKRGEKELAKEVLSYKEINAASSWNKLIEDLGTKVQKDLTSSVEDYYKKVEKYADSVLISLKVKYPVEGVSIITNLGKGIIELSKGEIGKGAIGLFPTYSIVFNFKEDTKNDILESASLIIKKRFDYTTVDITGTKITVKGFISGVVSGDNQYFSIA